MTPDYLTYDRAVYFPHGFTLGLSYRCVAGPGYEIRDDCVILRKGTDAPNPHRPSSLPMLVHGALYHALASGRLARRFRWRSDWVLLMLMRAAGCNIVHGFLVWLTVTLRGGALLRRQREAMLTCGSVLRPK